MGKFVVLIDNVFSLVRLQILQGRLKHKSLFLCGYIWMKARAKTSRGRAPRQGGP